MAHTPGPWKLSKSGRVVYAGSISITQHCGPSAASCSVDKMLGDMLQSNGKLIASAPDLLRIVRRIATVDWIGETEMGMMRRECIEIMERVEGKNE
jgi:hypothetical protein